MKARLKLQLLRQIQAVLGIASVSWDGTWTKISETGIGTDTVTGKYKLTGLSRRCYKRQNIDMHRSWRYYQESECCLLDETVHLECFQFFDLLLLSMRVSGLFLYEERVMLSNQLSWEWIGISVCKLYSSPWIYDVLQLQRCVPYGRAIFVHVKILLVL